MSNLLSLCLFLTVILTLNIVYMRIMSGHRRESIVMLAIQRLSSLNGYNLIERKLVLSVYAYNSIANNRINLFVWRWLHQNTHAKHANNNVYTLHFIQDVIIIIFMHRSRV